jgi:deoxyribodipyrimidine photo-lyase
MTGSVPAVRICKVNEKPARINGDFVLYWMSAFRRPFYNFALQRAVHWAEKMQRPILILEALWCNYGWASDRLHRFILEGMADNTRHFASQPVLYYPYVETVFGEGKGLLTALGRSACLVVTDDFPVFFVPRMVAAEAEEIDILLEKVDSNGILPLRTAKGDYPTEASSGASAAMTGRGVRRDPFSGKSAI